MIYAPSIEEIHEVAATADLLNEHPTARPRLLATLRGDAEDFDARSDWHTPGIAYGVESDTCMTGRTVAPNHVAYDSYGAEHVYRQPRNRDELKALMDAASVETFDSYRFDGLDRWTPALVREWHSTTGEIRGGLRAVVTADTDPEILEGARSHLAFLDSPEFEQYIAALTDYLEGRAADDPT